MAHYTTECLHMLLARTKEPFPKTMPYDSSSAFEPMFKCESCGMYLYALVPRAKEAKKPES